MNETESFLEQLADLTVAATDLQELGQAALGDFGGRQLASLRGKVSDVTSALRALASSARRQAEVERAAAKAPAAGKAK